MKKYDSINGLRTLACIGIILMHVKSNMNFQFGNYLDIIINSFTQFVFLFILPFGALSRLIRISKIFCFFALILGALI